MILLELAKNIRNQTTFFPETPTHWWKLSAIIGTKVGENMDKKIRAKGQK
jgi:hypothetical protein